jgi:DNA invertase Pin-like site-specific DNA recombinase
MKTYNVGIYARLSQESKNKKYDGDSVSINNQVSMLSKFIDMMPGWVKTRTYIDEGASGVTFRRKGFADMMEDARSGVINLVLVKDLSRFGRNYLEAGRYLEDELPALGCRFVSLADNIDTESGETDIMGFINAINDFFVRDTSDRIKSVMLAKAKDGQKLGGAVTYGYDRDPNQRTRLIVDEYAAAIVKKVYTLRLEGMGYNAIAGVLNREGIVPPRRYYFERKRRTTKADCSVAPSRPALAGRPDVGASPIAPKGASPGRAWTTRTIKLMLCNEIYLGHTISMKRGTRSYRDSRAYLRNESDWVRVENTHPPLVDRETWNKAQQINQTAKTKAVKHVEPNHSLFSGLLFCLDCHGRMGYAKRKDAGNAYVCRTYTQSGCVACSSHRITELTLNTLVLADINKAANGMVYNEEEIYETLHHVFQNKRKAKKSKMAQNQRWLEQQLHNYDIRITKLYEDKTEALISAKDFYVCIREIETQRKAIDKQLFQIHKTIPITETQKKDKEKWASFISKKSVLNEVNRDILEALVDKIVIGAKKPADGVPIQDIQIYYKFNISENDNITSSACLL